MLTKTVECKSWFRPNPDILFCSGKVDPASSKAEQLLIRIFPWLLRIRTKGIQYPLALSGNLRHYWEMCYFRGCDHKEAENPPSSFHLPKGCENRPLKSNFTKNWGKGVWEYPSVSWPFWSDLIPILCGVCVSKGPVIFALSFWILCVDMANNNF